MSAEWLAAALAVLFLLSMFAYACLRARPTAGDEHGMPPELIGAEVAYAEDTFRSQKRRLVARLDRAYRTPPGLTLVELKTRPRDAVYMADVIELSVQRVALHDQTGEAVAGDAWVIVQHASTGARRPHRVHLMGVEQIEALSARFRAVRAGRVNRPAPARSPGQCEQCGHFERCSRRFGDRT